MKKDNEEILNDRVNVLVKELKEMNQGNIAHSKEYCRQFFKEWEEVTGRLKKLRKE